jgi:hypothetical protein
VIESRRQTFEKYLQLCLCDEEIANDPAFRKFLQITGVQAIKPALPPKPLKKCVALYDFEAQAPEDLPFKFGDVISVLAEEGEWWKGELNGRTGYFPSNYVRIVSEEELKFLEKANQRSALQSRPMSQPTTVLTNASSTAPSLPYKNAIPSPSVDNNIKRSSSPSQATKTTATISPTAAVATDSDVMDVIDNARDTQGPPDFLAVAMFDYDGQREQHEISFKFGDIVALYTEECRPTDDWWQGYVLNEDTSKLYGGYFPRTFVRRLTKDDFIYDAESGSYLYSPDITNYTYDEATDTYIKNPPETVRAIPTKSTTSEATSVNVTAADQRKTVTRYNENASKVSAGSVSQVTARSSVEETHEKTTLPTITTTVSSKENQSIDRQGAQPKSQILAQSQLQQESQPQSQSQPQPQLQTQPQQRPLGGPKKGSAAKGGFGRGGPKKGGGAKRALPTPPASQSVSVSVQRHQRISLMLRGQQSDIENYAQGPMNSSDTDAAINVANPKEGPTATSAAYTKRPITLTTPSPIVPNNQ